MPSKSKKQARFMAAAAHDPKFAKKAGIKSSVAQEFNAADVAKKGRKPTHPSMKTSHGGRGKNDWGY